MERYLGLDVHRDSTTVCVLNEAGKEIRREVVETHGEALVGSLRQLAGNLHLCIEEGEWSQWLYEILSPHVAEMVCVHVEWRPGSKSDAIDAHGLAESLRIGKSGPLVFRTPSELSKLRELARVYRCLTGDVVRTKNRLKALFRRRGVSCSGTGLYTPEGRRLRSQGLSTAYRPAVELLGWELDSLLELKTKAQKAMVDEAHHFKISRILETAPGLGPIRVAQMLPIVITPHRFRNKRQFWSYCGFGIVRRTSADWTQVRGQWVKGPVVQTRGLSRSHNRLLKAIFKSAATSSISLSGPNPLQHAYERLLEAGTKPNLAKLTIARKIAAIVLAMWKSEKEYEARS